MFIGTKSELKARCISQFAAYLCCQLIREKYTFIPSMGKLKEENCWNKNVF